MTGRHRAISRLARRCLRGRRRIVALLKPHTCFSNRKSIFLQTDSRPLQIFDLLWTWYGLCLNSRSCKKYSQCGAGNL